MSIFTLYLNLALISELQLPILTWRPTSTSKVVVGCYGLDCAPQKGYTEILTPSTSKCNLPWKRGCCRCTWLGRGHPGVQPPPDHCDSHPGQETPLKPQNPRENVPSRQRQRYRRLPPATDTGATWKTQGNILPWGFGRKLFVLPGLRHAVTAAPGH